MSGAESDQFPASYWDGVNTDADGLDEWLPDLQQAVAEHVGPIDVEAGLAEVRARIAAEQASNQPPTTIQTQ